MAETAEKAKLKAIILSEAIPVLGDSLSNFLSERIELILLLSLDIIFSLDFILSLFETGLFSVEFSLLFSDLLS